MRNLYTMETKQSGPAEMRGRFGLKTGKNRNDRLTAVLQRDYQSTLGCPADEKSEFPEQLNMTPYSNLPPRNFWSPAVGQRDALAIAELWTPKWQVTKADRVATFGSCFAQHFGKALARRGYQWTNFEPAIPGLSAETIQAFNFDVFSARTGNIYTVGMLEQWVNWATGRAVPPGEVWDKEGRFHDPFRPAVEPDGFAAADEIEANRQITIRAFAEAIRDSDVFVFTLGLTESWRNLAGGYEYPMCPGTVAGRFDAKCHGFVNTDYPAIRAGLQSAIAGMHEVNPGLRILLTVSPVPLTATASDGHVLVATTYSKSTLRAVAGDVAAGNPLVDYFPSYEIITAPAYGGQFFASNKRSVLAAGVDHVMKMFFDGQASRFRADPAEPVQERRREIENAESEDDLVCEEALLNAFAPRP